MSDTELDLSTLNDNELIEQIHEDLYDGLDEEIVEGVQELLERDWDPYKILSEVLVPGMDPIGADFRDGILFVPEVLLCATAMKAGMDILKPLIADTDAPSAGTIVMGTVEGDIHYIGKNLVAMLLESAGFEVHDIGVNISADAYIEALEQHNADILGMSALLTTTMPYMKTVIDKLEEKGTRDKYIVLIGGSPVSSSFAEEIGADGYCEDAAAAVAMSKSLLAERKAA